MMAFPNAPSRSFLHEASLAPRLAATAARPFGEPRGARLSRRSASLRSRVVAPHVAPPARFFSRPRSLRSLRPRCASGRPRSRFRPTPADRPALAYRNTVTSSRDALIEHPGGPRRFSDGTIPVGGCVALTLRRTNRDRYPTGTAGQVRQLGLSRRSSARDRQRRGGLRCRRVVLAVRRSPPLLPRFGRPSRRDCPAPRHGRLRACRFGRLFDRFV